MDGFERVEAAAATVRRWSGATPTVGVVLGSGLGGFAHRLTGATWASCDEIAGWPVPRVIGHAGKLAVGVVGDRRLIVLSGRAHFYEGHSMEAVTFPVRVLGRLGVKAVVLTNAAGGLNPEFPPGTLMVLDDHINLMGVNPLVGANDDRFGPRFPDMSEVYSRRLRDLADAAAASIGQPVEHGVYLAVSGPSYETPAEIRAFRWLGADAVGMSTVPEALVARHMGLEVLGISCLTNMGAGMLPKPISAEEVLEVTARVQDRFTGLLEAVVARI